MLHTITLALAMIGAAVVCRFALKLAGFAIYLIGLPSRTARDRREMRGSAERAGRV